MFTLRDQNERQYFPTDHGKMISLGSWINATSEHNHIDCTRRGRVEKTQKLLLKKTLSLVTVYYFKAIESTILNNSWTLSYRFLLNGMNVRYEASELFEKAPG